jgi:pimeloyl-ACP methyl ester carboxylesterase
MSAYTDAAAFSLRGSERPGIVVALHGLTGDSHQPLELLGGFDSPDWGVLAPDLRAHGDTAFEGEPEDFAPDRLATDVIELLESLALVGKRIRVLGISLGATVALLMARDPRIRVEAAVFVRPAHDIGTPANLEINLTIARLLRQDPSTALTRLVQREGYLEVARVSESGATGLRNKVTGPRSAERAMRLEQGSIWSAFDGDEPVELGIPALVVAAPEDPLHPVAVAENWHRRLPGSRLAMLPPRDTDPVAQTVQARMLVQTFLAEAAAAHPAQKRER